MAVYFFDLDGTLADSRLGLFASFRAGLAAIGVAPPSDAQLQRFLGTPLPEFFTAFSPALSRAALRKGIAGFRQHYDASGILQNTLYRDVLPMLEAVRQGRHGTWVVTSKPQPHAERAVFDLGLARFIDGIVGAGLDETDTKTGLVRRALDESGADPARTIMLGDRAYDVIGALENGVRPVGALWGYGTQDELCAAGCRDFAESAKDFAARFVPALAFTEAAE
jgi:phosphoglycolate phosphatase